MAKRSSQTTKSCPILYAGTMLTKLSASRMCGAHVSDIDYHCEHKSAKCLKRKCLWYEHGCPAYPREIIIT